MRSAVPFGREGACVVCRNCRGCDKCLAFRVFAKLPAEPFVPATDATLMEVPELDAAGEWIADAHPLVYGLFAQDIERLKAAACAFSTDQ